MNRPAFALEYPIGASPIRVFSDRLTTLPTAIPSGAEFAIHSYFPARRLNTRQKYEADATVSAIRARPPSVWRRLLGLTAW